MKTTELFVEQVLIGFMVLVVAALVCWPDVYAFVIRRGDKSLELVVIGGILIGAAYLIGIVYDRVADTLLQDIEAHGRLQFALDRFKLSDGRIRTNKGPDQLKRDADFDVENFDDFVLTNTDPFKDGMYRHRIFGNSDATGQMEYLRSRIRLTRAMATIIPALIIALLLAIDSGDAGELWTVVAVTLPLVYAATFLLKAFKSKTIPFYRPPKTYRLKQVSEYIERAQPATGKTPWRVSQIIADDEIWVALAVLTLVGSLLVLKTGAYALLSILFVGLVLTIVVGWTWWRISMTFYSFIRDYANYGGKSKA